MKEKRKKKEEGWRSKEREREQERGMREKDKMMGGLEEYREGGREGGR